VNDVLFIRESLEPLLFSTNFYGWYLPKQVVVNEDTTKAEEVLKNLTRIYTFEELKQKPKEVDPTKLEMYLSDVEFEIHFEMKKDQFLQLSSWKKDTLKQKVGLF